ncbi:MAG: Smr/MutS family protein [Polyangiaceae bacterium]|nr:Smr/MutS family protein [Polyangiaceae bacterium]
MSGGLARARVDLGWSEIVDALADRAVGAQARRDARALGPLDDAEWSRVRAEVREAMNALADGDAVPLGPLPDVDAALERVRVGAALAPAELRDVATLLESATRLRRWLASGRDRRPALHAACSTDRALDELGRAIAGALDPDGSLSDAASPRLAALRGERAAARGRLVARLEEVMRAYAHVLSDSFWTEREGRYVLPLRADAHERFPGIVHASSASGATLFVEPRALVTAGNRLKVLDGEVRREEDAVLSALTGMVAEQLASVGFAVAALARADLRAATARLALDLSLEACEVSEAPGVALLGLRHPLLTLRGVDAVPSDVSVASGHALVVSGPNAGGKTVVLKAVGLAALMHRAGLPVAARRGSSLGRFDAVLTDVGDEQSLRRDLSTFGAHAARIAEILAQAGGGALALVDELATGTDPREGEALAAAVLDGLCRRGATTIVTTHYEGLKALATTDARLCNASVSLDPATLSPTFRLTSGVPGASSALAVAGRFGVPREILERARGLLTREDRDFELLITSLTAERRALELAQAAAVAAERAARSREEELAAALEAQRRGHEQEARGESARLVEAVRRARASLREIEARQRQRPMDEREVARLRRAVDDVAQQVALGGALSVPPDELPPVTAAPERGARVFVPQLRGDAEILDVLADGRLRVAAGALKLTVSADEVRAPRAASSPLRARRGPVPQPAAGPLDAAVTRAAAICDLRGLGAADATRAAERFVVRSLAEGREIALFSHGQGTDALRAAVRASLTTSRHVRELRSGLPSEGGDGVTVVWLRG